MTVDNPHGYANPYLLIGGAFSMAFALFQLSAIFWTQEILRYYGGPASMQSESPWLYIVLCIVVAALAALCGLYAFSGAGKFRRLPFLRTVLITITAIYILRGLAIFRDLRLIRDNPEQDLQRFAVYSAIALCAGLVHLAGVIGFFRKRREPATT